MRALFDSNILIDLLNGRKEPLKLLRTYEPVISIVTYIEVLCGAISRNTEDATTQFLGQFKVENLGEAIAAIAANVRHTHGIKIADAIIYATAKHLDIVLLTRNTKDFGSDDPYIKIPYK